MTTAEISTFIEIMEELGDVWTIEDVQRVYGNNTLEEALADRRSLVTQHNLNIATIQTR